MRGFRCITITIEAFNLFAIMEIELIDQIGQEVIDLDSGFVVERR